MRSSGWRAERRRVRGAKSSPSSTLPAAGERQLAPAPASLASSKATGRPQELLPPTHTPGPERPPPRPPFPPPDLGNHKQRHEAVTTAVCVEGGGDGSWKTCEAC